MFTIPIPHFTKSSPGAWREMGILKRRTQKDWQYDNMVQPTWLHTEQESFLKVLIGFVNLAIPKCVCVWNLISFFQMFFSRWMQLLAEEVSRRTVHFILKSLPWVYLHFSSAEFTHLSILPSPTYEPLCSEMDVDSAWAVGWTVLDMEPLCRVMLNCQMCYGSCYILFLFGILCEWNNYDL